MGSIPVFNSSTSARMTASEASIIFGSVVITRAMTSPALTDWNCATLKSTSWPGFKLATFSCTISTSPVNVPGARVWFHKKKMAAATSAKMMAGSPCRRKSFQRCAGGVGMGGNEFIVRVLILLRL